MDDSSLDTRHEDEMPEARRFTHEPPSQTDDAYWSALLCDEEISQGEIQLHEEATWHTYGLDSPSGEELHHLSIDTTADWDHVSEIFEGDTVVSLDVIGYNRGGLLVKWGELRGFVPASQLVDFPSDYELEATRNRLLNDYLGKSLELRIIELDRQKNRLILSERAAQTNAGARDKILHNLQAGNTLKGIVTNLCAFGAFVDLGGVEGLIHISELSWGRVRHPADILKRGDEVKVYVLDVSPDEGRVVLSVKRLQNDPWAGVEQRYQVGQTVTGEVTNVVDFGAFICIEEGLEGLVHISELAEGHFLHPYNVVREGEQVSARILHIDGTGRRLGLSLRQCQDDTHPEDISGH